MSGRSRRVSGSTGEAARRWSSRSSWPRRARHAVPLADGRVARAARADPSACCRAPVAAVAYRPRRDRPRRSGTGRRAPRAGRAPRTADPAPRGRPIQVVAADLRRLSRQLALVPAGATLVRWQALWAAYDGVLIEAAEMLEVPHELPSSRHGHGPRRRAAAGAGRAGGRRPGGARLSARPASAGCSSPSTRRRRRAPTSSARSAPLRGRPGEPRWTDPSRWHLTLLFLGAVPDATGAAAGRGGRPGGGGRAAHARCGWPAAGRFGSPRRPQVAWAGLDGDVAPLVELAARLAAPARSLRLAVEDRPFRPHLTLGRWRPGRPADGDLIDRLAGYRGPDWPVAEVRLLESHLGPTPALRDGRLLAGHSAMEWPAEAGRHQAYSMRGRLVAREDLVEAGELVVVELHLERRAARRRTAPSCGARRSARSPRAGAAATPGRRRPGACPISRQNAS